MLKLHGQVKSWWCWLLFKMASNFPPNSVFIPKIILRQLSHWRDHILHGNYLFNSHWGNLFREFVRRWQTFSQMFVIFLPKSSLIPYIRESPFSLVWGHDFLKVPQQYFCDPCHYKRQWYAFLFTDNHDVLLDKRMMWIFWLILLTYLWKHIIGLNTKRI